MPKKNVLLYLICLMLLICPCVCAENISVYCEYDDGSRVAIEDGCTIQSDGELTIALEGLEPDQVYRVQFKGEAIDKTPFVDHQGTVGEQNAYVYYLLTHKKGIYGPFELVIGSIESQQVITFSVDVEPNKDKDWLEYGVLNEAGYAEMPPFLPIVPGEVTAEMQTKDFGITEPKHGSVYSGDENCQFWITIEAKTPNKELEWRIIDLATNKAIIERYERLPYASNFSMPVEAESLEYGCEYGFEIVAGKQRAYSTFSVVEEKGGITADIEATLAARQALQEKAMEEHATHDAALMNEKQAEESENIINNQEQFKFIPMKKNEGVTVNKALYDRLVDEFNAVHDSYGVGGLMEYGLYAYNDKKDEGTIYQSFAQSMASEPVSQMEMNFDLATKQMGKGLVTGFSISEVYNSLGMHSRIVPVNAERINEVKKRGNGEVAFGPAAYTQILTDDGKCIADIMLCAEWVNGKIYGRNRYVYTRFEDPRGDGTQAYEWFCADQTLVRELINLMDQTLMEWAEGADASMLEESEVQRYVRIRESGNVNVRQKNNSESTRVGSAQAGKEYPCLSVEENGWFQIQLENGDIGFISGKMATLVE